MQDENNIECEIRAIIEQKDVPDLISKLKQRGKFLNETKRLSVMFFRYDTGIDLDLRVRETNGQCEMVMKRGDHHSHDRVETSQDIELNQFVGLVKIVLQFDWNKAKVGERDSINFDLSDGVLATVASAGSYSYLELEKMASQETLPEIQKELEAIANELNVTLIKTKDEYYAFCQKLTDEVDWRISDKPEDYQRLQKQLLNHVSLNNDTGKDLS
jgi:hypothetical protein